MLALSSVALVKQSENFASKSDKRCALVPERLNFGSRLLGHMRLKSD